jgi:protease II
LQNIKSQKKLLHHSQSLVALRNNSFATQQQKTQIICNSKAKKLPIFGAKCSKSKSKKFLFIQVFQNQSKNCLFCSTVPEPEEKFPILVQNVSKIKEIYYTATINS